VLTEGNPPLAMMMRRVKLEIEGDPIPQEIDRACALGPPVAGTFTNLDCDARLAPTQNGAVVTLRDGPRSFAA
jgi:hypothetical protein